MQRCLSASVSVDGNITGKIDNGLMVLLGVKSGDTLDDARLMADKISKLRIFTDSEDKMNLSVLDIGGGILAISNFTLCADTKKGNRPSFSEAMAPDTANYLYEEFCNRLKENQIPVEKGVFGADMKINILCDGPVTINLDTDIWNRKI